MVSSVASLFIRFYLVITKAWKDIPHAFELLKRDGLPSFINRFFYYLNGIRLPQTEDRSVESTSKKVIFCCSNEVSEIRLSNSEIPKFLHFVFGYETAVLAAGKFSLAAVRTLNSFTSLRFYGLSFASAKNPETDIKSLKSKNYNFAVCNNLKACHFLTYFKAQNIISLVILNKHELNQNPEALFPELNFIVENADVIAVDSESAKKIIHDLGIDSAKIIVLSPKNKNTADNTKASLNELSSYEIYIRSLLSLLLNVSDSNNPAPAESIVKLAESSQLSFTKKNNIAIILHLYYFDLMEEICTYLNNITQPFDLYISVNPAASEESVKTLQALFPDSCIYVFENRGRDIAPFLEIFKKIIPLNYKYICKIHSKQSPHFSDTSGIAWRTGTFASLLGNSSIVNRILNYFDKHPPCRPASRRPPC